VGLWGGGGLCWFFVFLGLCGLFGFSGCCVSCFFVFGWVVVCFGFVGVVDVALDCCVLGGVWFVWGFVGVLFGGACVFCVGFFRFVLLWVFCGVVGCVACMGALSGCHAAFFFIGVGGWVFRGFSFLFFVSLLSVGFGCCWWGVWFVCFFGFCFSYGFSVFFFGLGGGFFGVPFGCGVCVAWFWVGRGGCVFRWLLVWGCAVVGRLLFSMCFGCLFVGCALGGFVWLPCMFVGSWLRVFVGFVLRVPVCCFACWAAGVVLFWLCDRECAGGRCWWCLVRGVWACGVRCVAVSLMFLWFWGWCVREGWVGGGLPLCWCFGASSGVGCAVLWGGCSLVRCFRGVGGRGVWGVVCAGSRGRGGGPVVWSLFAGRWAVWGVVVFGWLLSFVGVGGFFCGGVFVFCCLVVFAPGRAGVLGLGVVASVLVPLWVGGGGWGWVSVLLLGGFGQLGCGGWGVGFFCGGRVLCGVLVALGVCAFFWVVGGCLCFGFGWGALYR